MNRAIEQAGSLVTGWISSCLFCPASGEDDESFHHRQSIRRKGAERDMQICHTQQPHLVPPMRLVLYDDLPGPGPPPAPRASSIPSWVMEGGRNLASRASTRASMTFKRKSAAPTRISAPSDFRRVSSFTFPGEEMLLKHRNGSFKPLELTFNTPTNLLPDLSHMFDHFHLDNEDHLHYRHTASPLTRLPMALDTSTDLTHSSRRFSRPRTHHPSSSFQLPRKPVGSGSRRSSLATLEQHLVDRHSTPITSPLIPHFSTRSSAVTGLTAGVISPLPSRLDFAGPGIVPGIGAVTTKSSRATHASPLANAISTTAVPRTPNLPDRPSLPSIPTEEEQPDSQFTRPPTTTSSSESATRTPPRSDRVAQWLFQTINNTPPRPFSPSSNWKSPHILPEKFSVAPFRIRSRTLSGSTVMSTQTSIIPPFKTSSISSAGTTVAPGPPVRVSTSSSFSPEPSGLAKELELSPALPASFSRPLTTSVKQALPGSQSEERTYPTIYEGQQQHRYKYEDFAQPQYGDHRHSAVGVAF
ncbi:hypothetical protein FE257_005609 [Aspergillus nanangensis]|uniref:Uncharacterized protein n=1 Tax=Aspergillus nanangensis TaxID=2582783 RepID=A0AAD4GWQ4_ASPNN|nr:hypothetical protein FE257_005609 [Aspergillus nanangensis]